MGEVYTKFDIDISQLLSLSIENKERIITKLLENEDDLMPIVKKYLVGCLDNVMENPDEVIKDLIKEKDDTIKNLENKINSLEAKLGYFETMITSLLYGNSDPYRNNSTTSTSTWSWNAV